MLCFQKEAIDANTFDPLPMCDDTNPNRNVTLSGTVTIQRRYANAATARL